MRYIELSESARRELEAIHHRHTKSYVRQRSQCLLLSDQGYSVPMLADIFSTRTHTIRSWFDRWEESGVAGLEVRSGRGLKPAINEDDTALVAGIKKEVSADPRNLGNVADRISAQFGIRLSVRQLQTFLKKN